VKFNCGARKIYFLQSEVSEQRFFLDSKAVTRFVFWFNR